MQQPKIDSAPDPESIVARTDAIFAAVKIFSSLWAGNPSAALLVESSKLRTICETIARAKISPNHQIDPWRDLTELFPGQVFSDWERVGAALIGFAANELASERVALTKKRKETFLKNYRQTATCCEEALRGEVPNPFITESLRSQLTAVAEYFNDQADFLESHRTPYDRSSEKRGGTWYGLATNLIRGRALAISHEMERLLGSPHYGTVATILTVGLNLDAELDAGTVESWWRAGTIGSPDPKQEADPSLKTHKKTRD